MTDEQSSDLQEKPWKGRKASQVFGAVLIPACLVAAFYWIVQPVQEAQQTGELHYNLKGLLLPPCFLYMGIMLLFTDLRDGAFRTVDAAGKKQLTGKGKRFVGGLVAVIATTLVIWYFYLRSIGFNALG